MVRTILLFSVFCFVSAAAFAQNQAENFIKEAQGYLAEKNYQMAQLSLQDAIREINTMMGGQVGQALPDEINGLVSDGEETNTAGMGAMGGGTQIMKTYRHPTKKENDAEVQILANSPMLTAMNMYLQNPSMMGSEYKSIRIGTRRGILKSEMEDYYGNDGGAKKQIRRTEIQIPLSQTLITINARGFASEAEELAFVTKLDIEKLRTLLGE